MEKDTNRQEWQPDSDTQIIDEQVNISPISLELCCSRIIANVSDPKTYRGQQFINSQLEELLCKSVGAIFPTARTLFGVENKAFQNTHNRHELATLIADKVKLHLDGKLAGEAKETALRAIGDWLEGFAPADGRHRQRQGEQQPPTIPTLHKSEKERLVFGKAVEKGYMTLENECYRWNLTKSLLAYMCGKLYCGDRINDDGGCGEYEKGATQMPAQELKALFSGIDVASNRYNMKAPPRNRWKIDGLF